MEENTFADLHCHPHLRSFNWLRHSKYEKKTKLREKYFHPWYIVYSKPGAIKRGNRASTYSQSDLIKLVNGKVKLAFAALYPMEKGWFKKRESFPEKLILRILYIIWYGNKFKRTGIRDVLQSAYMNLPKRRINFFQSNSYDYFEELTREKDFLLSKNNLESRGEIYLNTFWRRIFVNRKKLKGNPESDATGTYEIAVSGADITRIISENKCAMVITIEGANVFDTENSGTDEILEKIRVVKNWKINEGKPDEKPLPVFCLNFAHHFNNELCGHCRSIPGIGKIFINQKDGLNSDFTHKGIPVIRFLLSLNEKNEFTPGLGRRILIDVKHMSARSRETFYREIIDPCMLKGERIPVLASHCGYSGKKSLMELIDAAENEKDTDSVYTPEKPFNTWSINLCDEDILKIFRSGGIIGMNLDQRILGMPAKTCFKKYPVGYDIAFFWRNLKAMMNVIIQSDDIPQSEKKEVVYLFGLGSDFDGYINPLDDYSTTLQFETLAGDLQKEIEKDPQKEVFLFGLTPRTFVKLLSFENALNFAVKNL